MSDDQDKDRGTVLGGVYADMMRAVVFYVKPTAATPRCTSGSSPGACIARQGMKPFSEYDPTTLCDACQGYWYAEVAARELREYVRTLRGGNSAMSGAGKKRPISDVVELEALMLGLMNGALNTHLRSACRHGTSTNCMRVQAGLKDRVLMPLDEYNLQAMCPPCRAFYFASHSTMKTMGFASAMKHSRERG